MRKERGLSRFIPDFKSEDIYLPDGTPSGGISLRVTTGGSGPPLVLLHGHPHNHVVWRKVAPVLAKDFTVIMPDLRGYGDSDKPQGDEQHRTYSKRVMAQDISLLTEELGYQKFAFVGHDRGARVGHRLALDSPDKVSRSVFIDIAPTATMYALTDKAFATRYFWWFFLIQPALLPETMIAHDPAFFLRHHLDGQLKIPGSISEDIFNEYLRCYRDPQMLHAVCEDYRAAASIDLQDDLEDKDKRLLCPLLLLWGAQGTVGTLYDVVATWKEKALHVQGEALPCGHSPQEEIPDLFLEKLLPFLKGV